MTRICWWLVDRVSRLLDPDERDAVRGDFVESGLRGGQALRDVLGLVARRQVALWKDWRPWLTLVGLVVPLAVLLSLGSRMRAHASAIPIWMYLNNWTMVYLETHGARSELVNTSAGIFKQYAILVCWSWASGFILGSLSRRTIPVNGALFGLGLLFVGILETPQDYGYGNPNAAVFSLTFYRVVFPLFVQAALVLLPSVWGMRQGLQLAMFPRLLRTIIWASVIATVAALAIMNGGLVLCSAGRFEACMEWAIQVGYARVSGRSPIVQIPTLTLALVGPVGYIVATAVWRRWRGKTMAA